MNTTRLASRLCIVIAALRLLFAYLDPGSGSLIVQLLIAAILGIFATFRLWKSRLLSLLGIRRESENEDEEDTASE